MQFFQDQSWLINVAIGLSVAISVIIPLAFCCWSKNRRRRRAKLKKPPRSKYTKIQKQSDEELGLNECRSSDVNKKEEDKAGKLKNTSLVNEVLKCVSRLSTDRKINHCNKSINGMVNNKNKKAKNQTSSSKKQESKSSTKSSPFSCLRGSKTVDWSERFDEEYSFKGGERSKKRRSTNSSINSGDSSFLSGSSDISLDETKDPKQELFSKPRQALKGDVCSELTSCSQDGVVTRSKATLVGDLNRNKPCHAASSDNAVSKKGFLRTLSASLSSVKRNDLQSSKTEGKKASENLQQSCSKSKQNERIHLHSQEPESSIEDGGERSLVHDKQERGERPGRRPDQELYKPPNKLRTQSERNPKGPFQLTSSKLDGVVTRSKADRIGSDSKSGGDLKPNKPRHAAGSDNAVSKQDSSLMVSVSSVKETAHDGKHFKVEKLFEKEPWVIVGNIEKADEKIEMAEVQNMESPLLVPGYAVENKFNNQTRDYKPQKYADDKLKKYASDKLRNNADSRPRDYAGACAENHEDRELSSYTRERFTLNERSLLRKDAQTKIESQRKVFDSEDKKICLKNQPDETDSSLSTHENVARYGSNVLECSDTKAEFEPSVGGAGAVKGGNEAIEIGEDIVSDASLEKSSKEPSSSKIAEKYGQTKGVKLFMAETGHATDLDQERRKEPKNHHASRTEEYLKYSQSNYVSRAEERPAEIQSYNTSRTEERPYYNHKQNSSRAQEKPSEVQSYNAHGADKWLKEIPSQYSSKAEERTNNIPDNNISKADERTTDTHDHIATNNKKRAKEIQMENAFKAEKRPKEKEKQMVASFRHLSVSEPILIDKYAAEEWKGETKTADKIRRGYEAIKAETGYVCIRRIRGDNYCALRAVLFKTLCCGIDITKRFASETDLAMIPLIAMEQYAWLNQWTFARRLDTSGESVEEALVGCLNHLKDSVNKSCSCNNDDEGYKLALGLMNENEASEIKLFEAVKFLMLYNSIKLFDAMNSGKDVCILPMLLFARDTSQDPKSFMKNHLNHVGESMGFDQLEMMLLAHTLKILIKVMRLNHVDESDFIAEFSDDSGDPDLDSIFIVAEDDRHYNVLSEEL